MARRPVSGRPSWAIRQLTPADEAAMLEVDRRCAISAGWQFRYDRDPDFFAWPRMMFDSHAYVGAFVEDRLIGYGLVATYEGGRPTPGEPPARVLYVGDGRVLAEYRSLGVARELLAAGPEALTHIDGDDAMEGWTLVARKNRPAQRLVEEWTVPGFTVSRAADLTAHTLIARLPGWPVRSTVGISVHVADPDGIGALADLHARVNCGRPFAPQLAPERLAEWHTAGALHGVLLATRGRDLVGAAGLWDPRGARRLVIDRYPPVLEGMRSAADSVLRRVDRQGAPWLRPGRTLPTGTLAPLAATSPAVLRALTAASLQWARETGRLAVHVAVVDDDPIASGLSGLPRLRLRSTVLRIQRSGTELIAAPQLPYVDLAMV